jgi:DNA-binding transcriptional regulator YiaG
MNANQRNLSRISEVRRLYLSGDATKLRVAAGISQAEFAIGVNVSPAAVSLWEAGKRSPRGKTALECWHALNSMREALS